MNLDVTSPSSVGLNADALERLGSAIQADIDGAKHFGASVLVARHGQVVYQASFGTVGPGRAPANDDRYLLMSMSKAFTAALVLRAVDEGRFGLDTRVADLVPGFGALGKQRATVRQLLSHTAGLPFGLVPPPLGLDKVGNLEMKTAGICALPAAYRPGTKCIYTSGLGYDLLGQILVNVDSKGRNFSRIAEEDLFKPLGMADSSFGCSINDPRRVPVSFTDRNVGPTTPMLLRLFNEHLTEDAEMPSGNAYSTIHDVFRFTEVFRGRGAAHGRRVLSPALFNYARRDHTTGLINDATAFEVEERGLDDFPAHFTLLGGYVRGMGHMLNPTGHTASPQSIAAVGGASTSWMIDLERDLTVVFLSAGFIEGLRHIQRVQRINDLALAAVDA